MRSSNHMRRLAFALSGVAVLGLFTVAASQQKEQESVDTPEQVENIDERDATIHLGGLEIAVDPETGDIRPLTRQEAAQLAREMRRLFEPRDIGEPTLRPDGSMSAVVVPNVLRFSTARVQPDGSVALSCSESTEDAIEHLTHLAEASGAARPGEK